MSHAVELVRFRVTAEHAATFLERRPAVDAALKSLAGFLGSELFQVNADEWLLVVRWESRDAAHAAQAVTRDLALVSEWIGTADAFLSFDTADVRYTSA